MRFARLFPVPWPFIAIPLVGWLCVAVAVGVRTSEVGMTGDPLLDALVEEVQYDLVDGYFDTYLGMPLKLEVNGGVQIEQSVFEDWEVEFGDDPRFWEMRHLLSEETERTIMDTRLWRDTGQLESARSRGTLGAAGFNLILRSRFLKWRHDNLEAAGTDYSELQREMINGTRGSRTERLNQYKRYNRLAYDVVREHEKGKLIALLGEFRDAHCDYSMPHYLSAMFASELGDYCAVKEHLIAGNKACFNTKLVGFPVSEVRSRFQQRRLLGSTLVSGRLSHELVKNTSHDLRRARNMLATNANEACLRGDLEMLDALHQFLCRYGSMENGELMDAMAMSSLLMELFNTYQELRPAAMNSRQCAVFSELGQVQMQLFSECRRLHGLPLPQPSMDPNSGIEDQLVNKLSKGLLQYAVFQDASCRHFTETQAGMAEDLVPLVRELQQFSYTELGWPEDAGLAD